MEEKKMGLWARLKDSMKKTRDSIGSKVDDLVKYYREIDDEFFEELESVLISSDVGVETSAALVQGVKARVKKEKIGDSARIKELLKDEIELKLKKGEDEALSTPAVILMVGVNGVGKTTACGKLTAYFKAQGKSVLLAAADTFRAAAVEQLKEWGVRSDTPVVSQAEGSDPAAVVYDAVHSAKARHSDILICDTAGRLHNKKNLMNEMEKIGRVVDREYPEARREAYLVLDATTGQNAMAQAKAFSEVCPVSGIILTKLDGTAKGGIVISICETMGVPVKYIGIGEKIDDLQPFDARSFADALFEA